MSIAILLAVNDGIVLASDSAATVAASVVGGPRGVLAVYNNANKILHLHKQLPIGCVAFGAGSIGNASITTILKDFRHAMMSGGIPAFDANKYTIESVVCSLQTFLEEQCATAGTKPTLGILVGGYSRGAALSESWMLQFTNGICQPAVKTRQNNEVGMNWGGEAESIARLILGFSPTLPALLEQLLPDRRGKPNQEFLQNLSVRLQAQVLSPAMPIQDAIDLAAFLVRTAIDFSRFTPGAPTVGGPVEIAAITKHEGFKWIMRKHYYDVKLNKEGNR